mmetsp:Transcript_101595/g.292675  ORF Transcript_101595/g.292675 Transcript_101595/m.292675 type:complete len:278 (+) Transcript_101595:89-922(+)
MGRKSTFIVISVGALSSMMYLTGFLLPMHSIAFFIVHKRVARLSIHAMWARYEADGNDFCEYVLPREARGRGRKFGVEAFKREKKWFCPLNGESRLHSLQTTAHRWCSKTMKWFWPTFCRGLENAYMFGLLLFTVITMQAVVLQPVACWMLYDYASRKPDPRSRRRAVTLSVCGLLSVITVILVYSISVTTYLDIVRDFEWVQIGMLFSPSTATGFAYGLFMLWTGVGVHTVQLWLFKYVQTPREQDFEDFKAQRDLERDYGTMLARERKAAAAASQ